MQTSTAVVISLSVIIAGIVAYSIFKPTSNSNSSNSSQSGTINNQAPSNSNDIGIAGVNAVGRLLGGLLGGSSSTPGSVRNSDGGFSLQDPGGGRNAGAYRGADSWDGRSA